MSSTDFPITDEQLTSITTEACSYALNHVTTYDHTLVQTWNTKIINSILQAIVAATAPTTSKQSPYKFHVNSTIIQHMAPVVASTYTHTTADLGTEVENAQVPAKRLEGRRGMHSASGGYWNSKRDGMFSYKHEGGEGREFDVVVSIVWVAVD